MNNKTNNLVLFTEMFSGKKIKFLFFLLGGDEAVFVYADEIIARIIAHSCRQSGLSIILTTLL